MLEADFDDHLEDQKMNKHLRKSIRDAINRLPERQKEVIYLRYILDFKNEEIAQIINITHQAVRNTLYKAIENLRKTISKEDLILFVMILKNCK
jgi:RNA polymerase sigma factor (sigma-70 family)